MFRPKFKFKDRVEVTKGFYVGHTATVQVTRFAWWPFGVRYMIYSEKVIPGFPASHYEFTADIAEGDLELAKEKPLVVTAEGVMKGGL